MSENTSVLEVLATLYSHKERFHSKSFADSMGVTPSMFFGLLSDMVSRTSFPYESKDPRPVFTLFGCRIYPIHNGIELTYEEAASVFFSERKERDT